MQQEIPIVTVDGPSGAGKGTLSHLIADYLGWHFLDSGAIYRVLAVACLHHGIEVNDEVPQSPLYFDNRLSNNPPPGRSYSLYKSTQNFGCLRLLASNQDYPAELV